MSEATVFDLPPPIVRPDVAAVRFMNRCLMEPVGRRLWEMFDDFESKVIYANGDEEWIVVPRGYQTDLASIPRFLPLMHAWLAGSAPRSAVIHDYLYWRQRNRAFADEVFRVAMENEEGRLVRTVMFVGVRLGGWTRYLSTPDHLKDTAA